MNKDARNTLLGILFDQEDSICVSPDQFGYQSVPVSYMKGSGRFVLAPQTDKQKPVSVTPDDIELVSMNAIEGARNDNNVTKLRSFLVEMDEGSLDSQFRYVQDMSMPFSACVFSGNKSLHFGITLTEPLPSYKTWRYYAEWVLNVMSKADQSTKNPSRSIRMAGNHRNGREMTLFKQSLRRIDLGELTTWLSKYEGLKPIIRAQNPVATDIPLQVDCLPNWVVKTLRGNFDTKKGRNNTWFSIGFECGLQGWGEEESLYLLGFYFQEEYDFTRREWETAVKSGIKKAGERHV